MRRKILVADLLCGAGGSSTGCARALAELGLEMELVCVNHWGTAIETHKRNHPEARHYVQDISTVRPHIIVPEGYLDLLMASPTCTHHSVARGGKPTSDQQRSDPWHIITWLTELRVKRIIIENVWEFIGWGPVDARTGRPVKSRKGEYFHAWIETIRRLGFDPEWRKLNAADYGDATTRQRFILMARSDRKRVVWPMPTHARAAEDKLSLFPSVKPWRPAREIIDWSIKGKSIFNRKKSLAPKTLARIYAGAVKFGWPEPFLVILRNHMAGQSINGPLPTIAANGGHIGLAEPVIMNGRKGNKAKGVSSAPVPTLDTKGGVWLAQPIKHHPLCSVHEGGACDYDCARDYPQAVILSQHNSGAPRSSNEPLPTITTGGAAAESHPGCARPMLVEPFILNRHGDNGGTRAHPLDEPTPTANCDGGGYLVEPFILSRQSCGAPRDTDQPIPTQTAQHSPVLISAYYGANTSCTSADETLPTITTKDRFGIVVPVTHEGGADRSLNPEIDSLPTVTGANRGELAFITAQFGEREGQAPRTHDLSAPLPVGPTLGHGALVAPTSQYDILFRMLEPHELAAAMGFNTEDSTYEFAGTKTEQIKQIGNAVSVAKMKACVSAIMADAVAKPTEKMRASDEKRRASA